jgi:hypothetical protein
MTSRVEAPGPGPEEVKLDLEGVTSGEFGS